MDSILFGIFLIIATGAAGVIIRILSKPSGIKKRLDETLTETEKAKKEAKDRYEKDDNAAVSHRFNDAFSKRPDDFDDETR